MKKNNYTFIDLFAGAGGLSEGLSKAGLTPVYASDIDELAMKTFKYNHPGVPCEVIDIKNLSLDYIKKKTGKLYKKIDVLVGGPPCQGFSLAGLRIPDSPKNKLVVEYLRMVKEIKPKIFLFENVPGIISMQDGNVVNALTKEFSSMGYTVEYKVLNPVNFGVPQSRPRFIMIGTLKGEVIFPEKTHKNGSEGKYPTLFDESLLPAVTVKEAFSGLPEIGQGEGDEEVTVKKLDTNKYHKMISGNRLPGTIYNHRATKHSERITERYSQIPAGGTNKDLPVEIRTKKNNVFRLHPDKYSRTVTCNFRTDLLHPWKPRGLTVREAARLQSFDDDYRFFGNLTRKAKWLTQDDQVGNSVPPLFAKALGKAIIKMLKKYE